MGHPTKSPHILAHTFLLDWFWEESLVGKILKLDDIGLDDVLNGN